jgi:hypothetical protein
MNIVSPLNPLELEKGIPSLSVNHISTVADFRGQSSVQKNKKVMTTIFDVDLNDFQIDQTESKDLLSEAVASLFSDEKTIAFSGEVVMGLEGIEELSIKSDFDRLLTNSVGEYLENLDNDLTGELKENLVQFIAPELENNEVLVSSLDALGIESAGQILSLNEMEDTLDRKRKEVEDRTESVIESEAGKVLDSVKKTIKVPKF